MSYSIKWLPEAEVTFALMIEYLEENWTVKEINSFVDRTEEVIGFIGQRPNQYHYSKRKEVYRAVVTRQVSLYYRINRGEIELLMFWDNRQDPEKLKV